MTVFVIKTALAELAFAAHYQSRDSARKQATRPIWRPAKPVKCRYGPAPEPRGRKDAYDGQTPPDRRPSVTSVPRRRRKRPLERRPVSDRTGATHDDWADVSASTQPYVTIPALQERKEIVYVDQRITRVSLGKICPRLVAWLRVRSARLGERVFSADDNAARQLGWQVTPIYAGLGRRYRDPRFDSLAACQRCGGRGGTGRGDRCLACAGAGRIVLGPALPPRISA